MVWVRLDCNSIFGSSHWLNQTNVQFDLKFWLYENWTQLNLKKKKKKNFIINYYINE